MGLPININDVMILPTKYICYHEHNFYVAQQIDFLLIKVQGYQQGSTKVDNYKLKFSIPQLCRTTTY